jgi:hypothetical protein
MRLAMYLVGLIASAALALAGCSSSSSSAPATAPSPTTTMQGSTTAPAMPDSTAQNLAVTDAVRQALIQAVSTACSGTTTGDFLGFKTGLTYYAIYGSTGTSWAAGQAVPSPAGLSGDAPAGVCLQDAGSYWIFTKSSGASAWKASPSGYAGPGSGCTSSSPPVAVTNAWGWPAGSCRPASNP